MQYKTAVLIQAHNNFKYIEELIINNNDILFIIHIDKRKYIDKSFIDFMNHSPNSIILLDDKRVNVYWGGSSQILATLNLLIEAYKFNEIQFFHLLSAECVPLIQFKEIERQWEGFQNLNFIECRRRKEVEWRLRVNMYYNNTALTRTFIGKVLNRLHKNIGELLNLTNWNDELNWYGSQWFSINRQLVSQILDKHQVNNYFNLFKFKTCSDEHAFQFFIKDMSIKNIADDNKRYIDFRKNKSSPSYLTYNDLEMLRKKNIFWFARKVREEDSILFIKNNK